MLLFNLEPLQPEAPDQLQASKVYPGPHYLDHTHQRANPMRAARNNLHNSRPPQLVLPERLEGVLRPAVLMPQASGGFPRRLVIRVSWEALAFFGGNVGYPGADAGVLEVALPVP